MGSFARMLFSQRLRPAFALLPGWTQTELSRSVFWGILCVLLAVLPSGAAAQKADEWIGVSASHTGGIGFSNLDPTTGSFSPISLTFVSAGISRDGRRVAYRRGTELRVSNLDGTEDRLLAEGLGDPNVSQTVRWSPAGDRIAFLDGKKVIQVISTSGSRLGEISDGNISGVSAISDFDWSPDGSRIAYGMVSGVRVPIAKKRERVPGLDTLRFFCALWVVFAHIPPFPTNQFLGKDNLLELAVRGVLKNLFCGPAAVTVFDPRGLGRTRDRAASPLLPALW